MGAGDLFIVSAPSGSGKTTICRMLLERVEDLELSVSYTTRPRKEGEVDGKDYYFIDEVLFDKMVNSNDFLESATVYGNRYGTSREAVNAIAATRAKSCATHTSDKLKLPPPPSSRASSSKSPNRSPGRPDDGSRCRLRPTRQPMPPK